MNRITEKQAAALAALLRKLSEKSSVVGYLVGLVGYFGVTDTGRVEQIGGVIALVASILLILFNDATVRSMVVANAPTTAEAMEPDPTPVSPDVAQATHTQEFDVSILDKLQLFTKLAPIVTTAVQVAEAVAPDAPGVQKLAKAQAGIAAAVQKANDIQQDVSTLWDVINPLIELAVATVKTTGTATPAASPSPAPN